jgi:apolipoprotein N-acyltransferase
LIPVALVALPALLAFFWAIAAAIAVRFWSSGPKRIAIFALAIMLAEFGRGHAFGGFPWNLPAYVWPAGGEVSQAAAFVGAYGLSAITLLMLAAPATLADAGRFGFRVAPTLIAALGLGLLFGGGMQRLAAPSTAPQGPIVRVADAGFTQVEKWTRGNEPAVFQKYLSLIDGPTPSRADIVIWPESAMPFLLLEDPDAIDVIGAQLGDRVLVLGVTRREARGGKDVYFNSGAVLDSVGGRVRLAQIYNKSRLVPGGEFIPLWSLVESVFGNVQALQQIGSGFTPGDAPTRIVIPGAGEAAILICYEAIFPGFAPRGQGWFGQAIGAVGARHEDERPRWLISLTNDAWFGAQTGPYQHFNQARYRAIEEGLPMARAASGGVSAIVDAYGRVVVKTGLRGGAVEASLPAALPLTVFANDPNTVSFVVFVVLALLVVAAPRGRAGGRTEVSR